MDIPNSIFKKLTPEEKNKLMWFSLSGTHMGGCIFMGSEAYKRHHDFTEEMMIKYGAAQKPVTIRGGIDGAELDRIWKQTSGKIYKNE